MIVGRSRFVDVKYVEFANEPYLLNLHATERNILISIYYYYYFRRSLAALYPSSIIGIA